MSGIPPGQEIERINPDGMPAAYSHVIRYGELLFLAGQVALDGDGDCTGLDNKQIQSLTRLFAP